MSNERADTRQGTKLIIWGRAGGRCQYRNCHERLDGDLASGNLGRNKSYIAHIIAASPGGERGDPILSPLLADDPDNLMLMCDAHHREIDDARKIDIYTVDVLRAMKREHEDRVDRLLSIRPFKSSHILQVSAPIGDNETAVPFDDCAMAVTAEAKMAERPPIEIKLRGMRYKDSDPDYYRIEIGNLRRRFDTDLRWRFEDGQIEHLSVFGLAPIPILMELGRLISDISDASVYGRHREPRPQWTWPNDAEPLLFSRKTGRNGTKKVALKLSITAEIADDRVVQAMGSGDISVWEIRSSRFGTSALRNQSDLTGFRLLAGRVFDEMRSQHGSDVELSVFPAVPVACAIEFGRVWQQKAHPAFDIYDEIAGSGFVCRHRIESQAVLSGAA